MSSYPDPATVAQEHGKPYPPQEQALGEVPSVLPDVPVCAVFLFLFICCAAGHMTLFKLNMHRGKKFVISGMMFGFCFTRIMATSLRIAWACYPKSVKIGIAAMVFVYAGIILLFIANLFFTQRIVRAQHPHFGWRKIPSLVLPALLVIVIGSILALIVSVILSFYTLNHSTLYSVYIIQQYGETLYMCVAFLPIPIVLASTIARRHPKIRGTRTIDKFGSGKMRTKVLIVLVSAVFLCLGASWRASILYLPLRDSTNPVYPWYFTKECFYVFDFGIELCVVASWLLVRIDKRFHIPDGAKGPFSYGGGFTFAGEAGNEKIALGQRDSMRHLTSPSQSTFGRHSRMSWGGVSRESVATGRGEDGFEIIPYSGFDHMQEQQMYSSADDVGVEGAEAEMGWDPKSGKWALRPLSSMTNVYRPAYHASSETVDRY